MNFDFGILDFIQANMRSDFFDAVMPFITRLGDAGIIWILATLVLLAVPKTRKVGIAAAASLLLEVVCCNLLLKPLVARTRPYDINTAIQLLIQRPLDFSFPSGHTSAAFAVVSALFFSKNRLWILGSILAVLIAFSRLYLYVHFPSDVFVGALIGIASGWIGSLVVQKGKRE